MRKIALLCAFCAALCAHSLKGFASEEGGEVAVRAYFYGGSPCAGCEVSAILEDGSVAASAKTDERGFARFALPAPKFEIRINGGLGHEKRFKFESRADSNLKSGASGDSNLSTASNPKSEDNSNLNDVAKFAFALVCLIAFFGALWLVKRPRKTDASNLNDKKGGRE